MNDFRRYAWAGATALALSATLSATLAASTLQKADKDAKANADAARPKMKLSAQPMVSISPARVVLTAELVGGANDFEEFYCPAVEFR